MGLVKEDIPSEVEIFRSRYWQNELFLDEDQSFFKALGGGHVHKPICGIASFLAMLANPFNKSRTKVHLKALKTRSPVVENNLIGEGFITGGVYVIRRDGTAAYSFLEEEIGDRAPMEDVIVAVAKASRL